MKTASNMKTPQIRGSNDMEGTKNYQDDQQVKRPPKTIDNLKYDIDLKYKHNLKCEDNLK